MKMMKWTKYFEGEETELNQTIYLPFFFLSLFHRLRVKVTYYVLHFSDIYARQYITVGEICWVILRNRSNQFRWREKMAPSTILWFTGIWGFPCVWSGHEEITQINTGGRLVGRSVGRSAGRGRRWRGVLGWLADTPVVYSWHRNS